MNAVDTAQLPHENMELKCAHAMLQDVSRRLREEQDEEYLRSLEADRERERQREEAEQQKAEARQAAEKVAAQER